MASKITTNRVPFMIHRFDRGRHMFDLPHRGILLALAIALFSTLPACDSLTPNGLPDAADAADGPADGSDLASDAVGDTTEPPPWPTSWQVVLSDTAPEGLQAAAADVVDVLGRMGLDADIVRTDQEPACEPDLGIVLMAGYSLGRSRFEGDPESFTRETYRVTPETCGAGDTGVRVQLAGRSLRAREYAAYAWLDSLGVRFFHPEQTYVPEALPWPATEWDDRQMTPRVPLRGVMTTTRPGPEGVHELTQALRDGDGERLRRFADWILRNRGSVVPFSDDPEYLAYLETRGVRRAMIVPLQGAEGLYPDAETIPDEGPDGPRVPTRLVPLLGDDDGEGAVALVELPAIDADRGAWLAQIEALAEIFEAEYPAAQIALRLPDGPADEVVGDIEPHLEILPTHVGIALSPPEAADLTRTTPRHDATPLFDLAVRVHRSRPVLYLPDSLPTRGPAETHPHGVPLFLPSRTVVRARELEALDFMADARYLGAIVRVGGLEWGAWQTPWCALRASEDPDVFLRECVTAMTAPMGEAAASAASVWHDAAGALERDLRAPTVDALAWLLRRGAPSATDVRAWELVDVERFRGQSEPVFQRLTQSLEMNLAQLSAVGGSVAPGGRVWFAEIFDGLQITALRARQTWHAFDAHVGFHEAALFFDDDRLPLALDAAHAAHAQTLTAGFVVQSREADYRYPLDASVGTLSGDERYLTAAHELRAFRERDTHLEETLSGRLQSVVVQDGILAGSDEALQIESTSDAPITVDFGDGSPPETGMMLSHTYAAPGIYELRVEHADDDGEPVTSYTRIASVEDERASGFSGAVISPSEASVVDRVLPAIVTGTIPADDGGAPLLVLGFAVDESGQVGPGDFISLETEPDLDPLTTRPKRVALPGVIQDQNRFFTSLALDRVVATLESTADGEQMRFSGLLSSDSAVDAVAFYAGFDEEGARELLASALGYTPETLPERLEFEVGYALE